MARFDPKLVDFDSLKVTPEALEAVLDLIGNHAATNIRDWEPIAALRRWLGIPAWPSLDYIEYPRHLPIRKEASTDGEVQDEDAPSTE